LGSTIGGGEHGPYSIEGIGNSFIPGTMDLSLVDEVIKVKDDEAVSAARLLAEKEGVIAGSSSGAALFGALQVANRIERGTVATLLPDRGERYFSKDLF
jgi:cysteine synthase A